MQTDKLLLEMEKVVKDFPGTRAVDSVSFDCYPGEIHCIVGENGAGKSTLIKMLAGVHQPNEGRILLRGKETVLRNNAVARQEGIGIVYQELSLLPELSIAENIAFGSWNTRRGMVDWKTIEARAAQVLSDINLNIDPSELIGGLPMAVRQMVEIGKVLSQKPDLIIFDEPTASLSKEEVKTLIGIIKNLRDKGKGIIYISHRLEEVFALADRVTVIKDGQKVITEKIGYFSEATLISSMVGRELKEIFPGKNDVNSHGNILNVEVQYRNSGKIRSFSVRKGEVLGIGGLQGQGQIKLLQPVFGLEQTELLRVIVNGEEKSIRNQQDAVKAGIALIPENRGDEGVFLISSVYENLASVTLDNHQRFGFIQSREETQAVEDVTGRLKIKYTSSRQPANSLSGGNMQKLVIGKWLIADPRVVILLEPTKGVDVGTKQQIYRIIRDLSNNNVAVVLYTSDMVELIGLSDRVLVMNNHSFTAELTGNEITEEKIMKGAVSTIDLDGQEVRA